MADQHEQDAAHYVHQYEDRVRTLTSDLSSVEALKKDGLAKIQNLEAEVSTLKVCVRHTRDLAAKSR